MKGPSDSSEAEARSSIRASSGDTSGVDHPVPAAEDFATGDTTGVEHPVPAADDFSGDTTGVDHPVRGADDFGKPPTSRPPAKK
jgi:hypothetical protein